jgi:hypothetical protein
MSDELPEQPEQPAAEDRTGKPERSGRRSTMLIIAAAVVVLAAIGVGIYLIATSGDEGVADPAAPTITDPSQPEPPASTPPSEPAASSVPPTRKTPPPAADKNVAAARVTAEQATTAINERDAAAMKQLSCDPGVDGSANVFPPEATARLAQNPEVTGNKATAQIELSISGSEPTVVPLPMEKRDGRWCVP